jgi:hypothetical protein
MWNDAHVDDDQSGAYGDDRVRGSWRGECIRGEDLETILEGIEASATLRWTTST